MIRQLPIDWMAYVPFISVDNVEFMSYLHSISIIRSGILGRVPSNIYEWIVSAAGFLAMPKAEYTAVQRQISALQRLARGTSRDPILSPTTGLFLKWARPVRKLRSGVYFAVTSPTMSAMSADDTPIDTACFFLAPPRAVAPLACHDVTPSINFSSLLRGMILFCHQL